MSSVSATSATALVLLPPVEHPPFVQAFNPDMLRIAMDLRGITPVTLAALAGLHEQIILDCSTGRRRMMEADLPKLAKLLDLPDAFFCREGKYEPPSFPVWDIVEERTTDIDVAAVSDDWEDLVSAGHDIAAASDRNRWKLGHIAMKAEKRYRESSIKKLAGDIGLASAKTLYDYYHVTAYYGPDAHAEYPELSWSHFRAALRFGDVEKSRFFLSQAADNNWPVAELNRAIVEELGKPVPPVRETFMVNGTLLEAPGVLRVFADEAQRIVELMRQMPGATMTIVVTYEKKVEAA